MQSKKPCVFRCQPCAVCGFCGRRIDSDNRTDLKDAAGISFNVLAKMGRNEFISMESLSKICAALNCDVEDVISFSNAEVEQ